MAVNKVIYQNQTLVDLTNDTVSPESLKYGETAHDKTGKLITGSMQAPQVNVENKTITVSTASTTCTITGLEAQPKAFILVLSANLTTSSTRYVVQASSNGTTHRVTYAYKSGNSGLIYQSTSYLTVSYSNGTLTLKTSSSTNGGNFYRGNYSFTYVY